MPLASPFAWTRHLPLKRHSLFLDIGSSYTRVLHAGKITQVPTCLAIHQPSDTVVATGSKAQQLLGKTSAQLRVIFPVQQGVVAEPRYLELFLQQLVQQLSPSWSTSLVGWTGACAVPAGISPAARQNLQEVLETVHLGALERIPAAMAVQALIVPQRALTPGVCIVDVGGQTTTVTILSANDIIASDSIPIGGVTFTELIQEVVKRQSGCALGWQSAEQCLLAVGEIEVEEPKRRKDKKIAVRGKDLVSQVTKTVVVGTGDVRDEFKSLAEELLEALVLLFSEVPAELMTATLERGIFLTGRAAQLPGLAEFLQQSLQAEVTLLSDPDTSVVRGLASVRSGARA